MVCRENIWHLSKHQTLDFITYIFANPSHAQNCLPQSQMAWEGQTHGLLRRPEGLPLGCGSCWFYWVEAEAGILCGLLPCWEGGIKRLSGFERLWLLTEHCASIALGLKGLDLFDSELAGRPRLCAAAGLNRLSDAPCLACLSSYLWKAVSTLTAFSGTQSAA